MIIRKKELAHFLAEWEPTLRFFADDILLHPLSMPHLIAKGWRHPVKLRGTVASQLNRSFGSEAARGFTERDVQRFRVRTSS